MGLFDKKDTQNLFDKKEPKKADFSNVSSGSSTAADPSERRAEPTGSSRGADFGNVRSGGSSTAPVIEPVDSPTNYVVKSGDSLSKIARGIYGDAKQWTRIYEANRALIGDNPDLIQPGQNLVIPQD